MCSKIVLLLFRELGLAGIVTATSLYQPATPRGVYFAPSEKFVKQGRVFQVPLNPMSFQLLKVDFQMFKRNNHLNGCYLNYCKFFEY